MTKTKINKTLNNEKVYWKLHFEKEDFPNLS